VDKLAVAVDKLVAAVDILVVVVNLDMNFVEIHFVHLVELSDKFHCMLEVQTFSLKVTDSFDIKNWLLY